MDVHILAIETSSSLCGVALLSRTLAGERIYFLEHDGVGDHAERLLPMAHDVLAQAGLERQALTAIAFGQGPGGFTGLRVACGVAQGMAYALGLPVLPVPTLMAAAWRDARQGGLSHQNRVQLVLQDARMNEVYAGVYQFGQEFGWNTLLEPVLIDREALVHWIRGLKAEWNGAGQSVLRVSGDALDAFPTLRADLQAVDSLACGSASKADVQAVAHLALESWDRGRTIRPMDATPVYVRDKVAFTINERAGGRSGNPAAQDQALCLQPMQGTHLEAVLHIERQVQHTPWSEQNFRDALQAGYYAQVVVAQGKVQGFAVFLATPDLLQLLLIGVDPQAQGKGVASMLIKDGEQHARRLGLPGLMLEVRVSNDRARAVYEHLGYQLSGRRKNYYVCVAGQREDALVLYKTIPTVEHADDSL